MQARVRFVRAARNPLRRSCVSSAAKCRQECDLSGARATLCRDRACRVLEMQARVRFVPCARSPLRRSCVWSARSAGESATCPGRVRPSAEIVRVERAKCRRECDLSGARATLCRDRACQVLEMQARVRFVRRARDPLRRSCVSSARHAGESAFWRLAASLLEEVSYEALVLETCRFNFGGSIARSARFGDGALHFWRKSCTRPSFWRLGTALVELDSDLASS